MIYRFTLISDEADDFIREIQIDPEATFYDFHEAILKSVGYANDQMTSFFICDDDWEKEKEVTLEEMDDNPEIDSWVMKETHQRTGGRRKAETVVRIRLHDGTLLLHRTLRNHHRQKHDRSKMYQASRRSAQADRRL